MPGDEGAAPRRYGTFEGVFVPTLLTILGVILYLRVGWVVGNAGILGGIGIILLAYAITGSTGMSIASIATNTPIAGGGAYAIISRSLGLEAGGAIGVPLYLSQTLAIALYVFGFRGGWQFIFPQHPALVVDLGAFAVLMVIASISARFAFRVQYVILALVTLSLVVIALAAVQGSMSFAPTWFGDYPGAPEDGFPGTDFWTVFAVFFPATTGIMAGVNMSGELRDSRRSIPLGTLGAIGLTLVVYVASAYWIGRSASMGELASDYIVMLERSAWGPGVVAGLLGATFSSGLASIVGAPRILQALAAAELLPRSGPLARRTAGGEPRNALIVTGSIALAAILLRDLNVLAPIITLFFLITYGTINLVVLMEETLDLPTFRPTLRFPRIVALFGTVGCIVAMVVVNLLFTVIAVAVVVGFFVFLIRRQLDSPFSDVRSEMFAGLAQWASKRAVASRQSAERGWRPRVLAPIEDTRQLRAASTFLRDVTYPKGAVKMVGVRHDSNGDTLSEGLTTVSRRLRDEQITTAWSMVEEDTFEQGFIASMRASGVGMGRSNIVFLSFPTTETQERHARRVLEEAAEDGLGVLMTSTVHAGRLGGRGVINLWIREQGPDWEVSTDLQHSHLAILMAYKLRANWGGDLNLVTAVEDPEQLQQADHYLHGLADLARLPGPPGVHVLNTGFIDALFSAPFADLSLFALSADVDFSLLRTIIDAADTPCAFVRDSGDESAFI
ncbi:MAG: Na-K-Cl cotransporter [Actinobacteria bacterium]|nr:Na-K-Cl cotransporter [Actinomycetota bacterium]